MPAAPRRAPLLVLLLIAALIAVPGPSGAESECVEDATGDVEDRTSNTLTDQAEADILAACTSYSPESLEIAVRVAQPTDPATDPAWADFNSAVGAAIDVDGDGEEEFDANFGRFPDGQLRTSVFVHDSSEQACTAAGRFDGTRYLMTIPASCIGNPAAVSVAAFIFYSSSVAGQSSAGFYDEVPTRPAFDGPYTTDADPATGVERLAGISRVDTAIAISQDDFAPGAAGSVVLAQADNFPDALVAAPLAVATDGPLLLTPRTALARVTGEEIQRVLPVGGTVYLSGGTAALTEDVRAQVEALGYVVERVAGATRYATSVAIARETAASPSLIVVANGNGFPDALVGGSLAGFEDGVEILSDGAQLTAEGRAYLDENPQAEVVAIGATAAQAVPTATALSGEDAFATSVRVAERYGDVTGAALASGTAFPDGLAGGAHAARAGIPLLLTLPDLLPDSVGQYLGGAAPLDDLVVYGGVAAVAYQVEADAAAAAQ